MFFFGGNDHKDQKRSSLDIGVAHAGNLDEVQKNTVVVITKSLQNHGQHKIIALVVSWALLV